jgi:hypothetical protein
VINECASRIQIEFNVRSFDPDAAVRREWSAREENKKGPTSDCEAREQRLRQVTVALGVMTSSLMSRVGGRGAGRLCARLPKSPGRFARAPVTAPALAILLERPPVDPFGRGRSRCDKSCNCECCGDCELTHGASP